MSKQRWTYGTFQAGCECVMCESCVNVVLCMLLNKSISGLSLSSFLERRQLMATLLGVTASYSAKS